MSRPLVFLLLAGPASAEIVLLRPIDCAPGPDCFVQNHVDHDPGPGFADFACGHLGYDGHDGTDFALGSLAQMRRGVAVLAPAAGVVRATRDGMPDIASNAPGAPDRDGRDCGNAIVIDHAGGYSTQLCHLARGSVAVRRGDPVAAGQPIANVGLSGLTEFPHVHMTLRHNDNLVDPFRPTAGADSCDTAPATSLWSPPLDYVPARLTGFGITTTPPDLATLNDSPPPPLRRLPRDAPALVIWTTLLGPASGDRLVFRLIGPGGLHLEHTETLTRDQARALRYFGQSRPPGGWPGGTYRAEVEFHRDGQQLGRARWAFSIIAPPPEVRR